MFHGQFSGGLSGADHTCAVDDGNLAVCWGGNWRGQSSLLARSTLRWLPETGTAAQGPRRVRCWGSNDRDQVYPPEGLTFTTIAAGYWHNCGLTWAGELACWGDNGAGQTETPAGAFAEVCAAWSTVAPSISQERCSAGERGARSRRGARGPVSGLSCGDDFACALTSGGEAVCWGDNGRGQATPVAGTYQQVVAGGSHACGIREDALVQCWGNTKDERSTPP